MSHAPLTTPQISRWIALSPVVDIYSHALNPFAKQYLTLPAIELLSRVHRRMQPRRQELLDARDFRQTWWDRGKLPGYLPQSLVSSAYESWTVRPLPDDLKQRRVEITGPISDTKMVINMLNRGSDGHRADAAMLDFEDSMKPTWDNVTRGLHNLCGAVDGNLVYQEPGVDLKPGKTYRLKDEERPLIMVRCRGLHLSEANLLVDGSPVAAGLFDLTMAALLTAHKLLQQGRTPKYYIPKCEHYLEARWWNDLLSVLEEELHLEKGTLRATFLIETLPGAFQMEEILYEARDHAAGLNVGRWDKIFSDIKVLRAHADRIQADRATISMNRPWMRDYAKSLVAICHRHGALAIGGMASFTPGRNPASRQLQTDRVLEDKKQEYAMGHDGCWVSHPYFIGPALSAFPTANQLGVHPQVHRPDILPKPSDPRTMDGLRTNIRVGIAYMKGWQDGLGCVAWDDLMEDLATLEIARAQTWQWLHHAIRLKGGETVTPDLVKKTFKEELGLIECELPVAFRGPDLEQAILDYRKASYTAQRIFLEEHFRPFLAEASELAK